MTNEELVLLIRSCDNKKEYLEKLYCQNKGLIADIARKYSGLMEMDDLMQEGSIGLLEAAEKYDFQTGYRFSSYAAGCIRGHILNYLRDHGYIVRLPAYLLDRIRKLNKAKDDYQKLYAHEPSTIELAAILKTTPEQVEQLLSYSRLLNLKSINELLSTDDDSLELQDNIPDPEDHFRNADDKIQHEQLQKVLWDIVDKLDEKQSSVIHQKYENNQTAQEIADVMGISVCSVRTLEQNAMRELKKPRNTRKLESFFSDEKIYSLSLQYGGRSRFVNTWTSAPEQAVLFAEEMRG